MTRMFIAVFLLAFSSLVSAQNYKVINNIIKDVKPASIPLDGKRLIQAKHYRTVEININRLYSALEKVPLRGGLRAGVPVLIELPLPDGSMRKYRVVENTTMHPQLAAKFPEIKTYDGYGVGKSAELVKFDITPHGFHAMILSPGKNTVFIDPLEKDNTQYYMVYKQKDFVSKKNMKCGVTGQSKPIKHLRQLRPSANFNACNLKTYRLAMAATAQYTAFHGGTVPLALAAEVTTVNRVNAVYETDMAITLQIIPNNDQIIYTDPLTQPYTSGRPPILLVENQANVTAVIGAANYDIGHVVDAAGSGLATLGCVCNSSEKAEGVTGGEQPIGDPFDVDFLAHEIGHQFGANHTQDNDCKRNPATAVEPGSGSTIMGYAGICPPNVQMNSSPYFHGISLQEMGDFVSGQGGTCPVETPIPQAPTILSTNGFAVVPANTPFALTTIATNNGGNNVLTYTWEQMDNQISIQPPLSDSPDGPNFRSISPSVSPTRFFPNLAAIANNGPFTWEVVPSVTRTMNFRTTVRANTPGGSCNSYVDVTLTTDASSGPFILTYPTAPNIVWLSGAQLPVTWNVANTDVPPVNATVVDILLSIDGGLSYPFALLSAVPNNGTAMVTVPAINTASARIMVRSANGTFFTTSANNFSIGLSSPTAPVLLRADRNRLNPTVAFIYYAGLDSAVFNNDVYLVNGVPGAIAALDRAHGRFVISNLFLPQQQVVSITVVRGGFSQTSNAITIPSIL
ncbi:Ser-Thr-rich glycosyl-phosphatidyl-inositol-anchored membrane family protein [Legionella nautarum]|uniref:Ser-Thr-rich glycosyl-phosphatidyl-inositol-anchored membrane family protein n=1 Tax=Legionella nautarum TaxID=45070 RepID=A0A0W0WMD5_9GAMM|nr:zinc-dependent metalloprotease family protein [Legionella nautarum]KTD33270.1 Ser-Thr-rich glycosyl-phosphatidyl-inositol-anchored membrane family protein [Legionella nautarum]